MVTLSEGNQERRRVVREPNPGRLRVLVAKREQPLIRESSPPGRGTVASLSYSPGLSNLKETFSRAR